MSGQNPLQPGPKPKKSNPTQSTNSSFKKKIVTVGNRSQQSTQSRGPAETSPWLASIEVPDPHPTASFVEYLRWMRSPDIGVKKKDTTKVRILQMATDRADYSDCLTRLTARTRLIAGKENCFAVSCPWRIRVGGQRGPESILLPAFDSIGMPYIPSATLRGVARNQAIREFMAKDDCGWKDAEKKVAPWFGSLDEKGSDRTGKIIFLDAYPLANSRSKDPKDNKNSGGLKMDMANNIWSWSDDELIYKSNPNPFLSLSQPTFVIGLRPITPDLDSKILNQVQRWLKAGLAAGVGSQVNTGYGILGTSSKGTEPFLQVPFDIKGQLIHGHQRLEWNSHKNLWNNVSQDEVRPVAMKSMLRYWFRALSAGVLPAGSVQDALSYRKAVQEASSTNPPATVKALEALLFGSITPQCWGWLTVSVKGETVQPSARGRDDLCGHQVGNLSLSFSPSMPARHTSAVQDLCKALVWLMFHLGGVGQGARRPCYTRTKTPRYRGSTLMPDAGPAFDEIYGTIKVPNGKASFWGLPEDIQSFRSLFQSRLKEFYSALGDLIEGSLDYESPLTAKKISHPYEWSEAVDSLCEIVVVQESEDGAKPTALKLLHEKFHAFDNAGDIYNAKNLCGHTDEDLIPPIPKQSSNRPIKKSEKAHQTERKATPSPIWIASLDSWYQVVTIFGASQDPRKQFLKDLRKEIPNSRIEQIWPIVEF